MQTHSIKMLGSVLRLRLLAKKAFISQWLCAALTLGMVSHAHAHPETASMRITLDDTLIQSSTLTTAQQQAAIDAAQNVAALLESALDVQPLISSVNVIGNCVTGFMSAPVSVSAPDTDLLVLLSADAAGISVTGGFCQFDAFGRPIAAQLNFPPVSMAGIAATSEQLEDTVLKQFMTMLGFSGSRFSTYRDGIGGPVRSNVTTMYSQGGKTVEAVVTPNALAAARDHFDCPTLAGVELEDGVPQAAWETRIYDGEIMSGETTISNDRALSAITLGLLEDTGWYIPDYSVAEPFSWGKGEGCGFAQDTCDTFGPEYFCAPTARACNADRTAAASCSLVQYPADLPPNFQYFADPKQGGLSQLADYCPRYAPIAPVCADDSQPLTSTDMIRGITRGPDAACFDATLVQNPFTPPSSPLANCYTAVCSGTTIDITVGGNTVSCPTGGGSISFPGFGGTLDCPPVAEYCSVCGDGAITHEETCDDGNDLNGDGCSAMCKIETDYRCSGIPSLCSSAAPLSVPLFSPFALLGLMATLAAIAGIAIKRARN